MTSRSLNNKPRSDRKWMLAAGAGILWAALLARLYGSGGYTNARAILLSAIVGLLAAGALRLADEFARAAAPEGGEAARQRARNLAIALSLGALVSMFYIATLLRLGANALNRPM